MDTSSRLVQRPAVSTSKIWFIRILMAVMFLSTIFTGITFKGQFSFLYENEFTGQIERLLHGRMLPDEIIIWCLILVSHAFIFSLIFLVGHRYFYYILVLSPISYMVFYTLFSFLIVPLYLVPFILIWIISLIVCKGLRHKRIKAD